MDINALEEKLKKLGISIACSQQDTIISIQVKGLAGKALLEGIQWADQFVQEKVKKVLEQCKDKDSRQFVDPTFGPTKKDKNGICAICKDGTDVDYFNPSKYQASILEMVQEKRIRWERPIYATELSASHGNDKKEEEGDSLNKEKVFASNAKLFVDGVSSGDIVQGQLGDCWVMSSSSVLATRPEMLMQCFWRGDSYKSRGMFICRFMKNFIWRYVMIDDRIAVHGFGNDRAGKPFFSRCRDPNELWVILLEKGFAKLYGSYEYLTKGYIDDALNSFTGFCPEQVILNSAFPEFCEDPFAPTNPSQKYGDPFWNKLLRYKETGSLMGCSIQLRPNSNDKPESSAGYGLYFKHAYAFVDVGEIKTANGKTERLVKLRNPWGFAQWYGEWSDDSDERTKNHDAIQKVFQKINRHAGANASTRYYLHLAENRQLQASDMRDVLPEANELLEVTQSDGTFFMSYAAWMKYFTHFFAGIDFPDSWHGKRVQGSWTEYSCGGNPKKSSWVKNPQFKLVLDKRAQVFISLNQDDPRGYSERRLKTIAFHICSDVEPTSISSKTLNKSSEKEAASIQSSPPAIVPGTAIPGIDEDGVRQTVYTRKRAVSFEATMEKGTYRIIPSTFTRTNDFTGKVNVGKFWISVYANHDGFSLENGETISEEEEGAESLSISEPRSVSTSENDVAASSGVKPIASPHGNKKAFINDARSKGIGEAELNKSLVKPTNEKLKTPKSKSKSASSDIQLAKKALILLLKKLGLTNEEMGDDQLCFLNGNVSHEDCSSANEHEQVDVQELLDIFDEDLEHEIVFTIVSILSIWTLDAIALFICDST